MRAMLRTLAAAVLSPWSALPGLAAGLGIFALVVWLPNLSLIWGVVTGGSMSLSGKAAFLWSSLGAIGTNFTTLGASLTIAVAVLLGLDVAVAARYLRQRAAEARAGGAALGGVTLALLGAGCSSCGAIALSSLLGAGAAASFTASLPLGGQELSLASVAVLAAILVSTLRKASRPLVCAVEPPRPQPSPPQPEPSPPSAPQRSALESGSSSQSANSRQSRSVQSQSSPS